MSVLGKLPPHLSALTTTYSAYVKDVSDSDTQSIYTLLTTIITAEICHSNVSKLSSLSMGNQCTCAQPLTVPGATTSVSVTATQDPATATSKFQKTDCPPHSSLLCIKTKCGMTGHLIETCYKPGGGLYSKGPFTMVAGAGYVLLVDPNDLDGSQVIRETDEVVDDTDKEHVAPWAGVTFVPSYVNDDLPSLLVGDAYAPSCDSHALVNILPLIMLFLAQRFNTLLNSGCTHHIIHNRSLFHTFNESKHIDIGTANCGILSTHGVGLSILPSYTKGVMLFCTSRIVCMHLMCQSTYSQSVSSRNGRLLLPLPEVTHW